MSQETEADRNGDRLINVAEFAALAGVRPKTVRAWIRLRRVPAPRILCGGRGFRWPRAEIVAFLENLPTAPSTGQPA